MVRLSLLSSAIFAATVAAQAGTLIPNTLPACAQQCSALIGVQSSCSSVPSSAASCLCNALAQVRSAPGTNLCPNTCSPADWTTIANWYNQQACPNGVPAASTLATVATSAGATPASSNGAASGTAGGNAAASSTAPAGAAQSDSSSSETQTTATQNDAANYKNGQEWWNTHWQWIVMVIVLLIAFLVLGIGGRILFRRRQRRKNLGGSSGPDSNWAPNQGAHDFDTQGRQALAAAGPVTDEKRKSGSRKSKTLTRKLTGR